MGSFEAKFNYIPRGGSPEDEVTITVKDYFLKHYNHRVSKTFLPVVEAQNGALYPMDCCYIPKGQRYPFKLNESQTSEMIKFAATAPPQRRKGLEFGLTALNWANDPMLKHYKMRINRNFTVTKAKLLPPPSVEFWGKKLENPGTNGRWRIDKKQFIEPNKKTLKNWGVVILNKIGRDKIDKIGVMTFLKTFIQEYKGYGGRVENSAPSCVNDDSQDDIPGALYKCFETVRSKCK